MAIEPPCMAQNGDPDSDYNPDDSDYDGEDARSDTSSEIDEIEAEEFPLYFVERNGRLFHSHGGSPYPLPVDAEEQNRVNGQHNLLRELLRGNYIGPVGEVLNPAHGGVGRALDLGTGTGRWVLEMVAEFPRVRFDGLDIVPITTRSPPRNAHFEMHDVNEEFRYRNGTFDLVHARSISMAVINYAALMTSVARVLRPGGLFLACEWGRFPAVRNADPVIHLPRSHQFFSAVNECLRARRIRPIAGDLSKYIEDSGHFDRIQSRAVEVPVGDWPENDRMKRIGVRFREMLKLYATSMGVMMVETGKNPGEVDRLVEGYRHELDHIRGMVSIYYMVQGRRV